MKMSRMRMVSHEKNPEPENKRATRKSARLNNTHSNNSTSKTTSEQVLTRSRRRFPKCTSSCDESTVITDICTAGNCSSDSGADRSIVRTLRYSESSDKVLNNTDHRSKLIEKKQIQETTNNAMVLRSYNLRKRTVPTAKTGNEPWSGPNQRHIENKKSSDLRRGTQAVENDEKTANNVVLKRVTKRRSSNLPARRSPRFTQSVNETKDFNEANILAKKSQETIKPKRKKDEKNKRPSSVDQEKEDQGKEVKRPKVRKKGTLARKRELRAMLEKQDEGYEDDAFDGTPFRNRKPLLKCKLSPVVLDTSIQSRSTDTDCKTPCSRTPTNRLRPAGPYSSETSENDIITPGLLKSFNRNDIDCYVNQLKRRKIHLGYNRKIKSHTPLSKKPCKVIHSELWELSEDYKHRQTTIENENCENAEDYYWSDME